MNRIFPEWVTIEPAANQRGATVDSLKESCQLLHKSEPGWWAVGHGTYERYSVLEGQYCRCLLEAFDSLEEARAAYPEAEVLDHCTPLSTARVPDCPPADWSPLDAGEAWGEEDY